LEEKTKNSDSSFQFILKQQRKLKKPLNKRSFQSS